MSQKEIVDFLKLHPNEWFSLKQLSNELNISYDIIAYYVRSLEKKREITSKYIEVRLRNDIDKSVKHVSIIKEI